VTSPPVLLSRRLAAEFLGSAFLAAIGTAVVPHETDGGTAAADGDPRRVPGGISQ
jgi:hypothetical protein